MTLLRLTRCTVSLDRREVVREDQRPRALTAVETRLLSAFAAHPGEDLSRAALAGYGWLGQVVDARTVDSAIKRLRAKLDDAGTPRHILSSYGLGYRFVTGPDGPPPVDAEVALPGVVVALETGILDLPRFRFHPRDETPIVLTRAEVGLLDVLARPPGRTVGRDEIIATVWGRGSHHRALDAVIRRLRTKLGERVLHTVRGVGLRLEVPGRDESIRTNLDPPRAPFVDRPELGLALEALCRHRRVTLVGTAGIGKTRLAHEVGRRWLEAHRLALVRICDLSGAGSERTVLRQAALGIGLPPGCGDPEHRIGPTLAGLPAGSLLILDPFEHVLGCRDWVVRWAREAPEIRILVTSREVLGGEHVVPVTPLPLDAGCRLYTERAAGAFDPVDVRTLVQRLDGLPLAIELAATRADTFPPAVLAGMTDVFEVLVRRPAESESLHSTLRGAFDWSWDLLSSEERDAWAALSTFAGSFGADAAAAVGVRSRTLDGLTRRSILVRDGDGYRILDAARVYGAERLARTGLDAAHRHAAWCCAIADGSATWDGYGDDGPIHAAWDELWAVLGRTSDPSVRGRVGWALAQAAAREGWGALAEEIAALAVDRGVDDRHRSVLLARLGSEAVRVGRHADGHTLLDRAEAALRSGDERARAIVAWARVHLHDAAGRSSQALAGARRELSRLDGADPARRAHGLVMLGAFATRAWDDDGDLGLREQAVELARRAGDPRLLSSALRQWARSAPTGPALSALDQAHALAERGSWAFGQSLALRARMQRESEAGQLLAALSREAPIVALDADPHSDLASSTRLCAAFACIDLGRTAEARSRLRTPPFDAMNLRAWEQARLLVDRLEGRPRLPSVPADAGPSTLDVAAGAAAELGRLAEARTWLAAAEARSRSAAPRFRGWFERCHALTGALLAVLESRDDGLRRAREVLAAGEVVTCDDGVARERPGMVSVRRTLLELALSRP